MVYDFRTTTGSQTNIERTGERALVYNLWHRQFPGLGFVDIDHVEMCKRCQQPLALIETARDTGIALDNKKAHVTQNIARRLGIPALVLFYRLNLSGNIEGFRVQLRVPRWLPEMAMMPDQWASYLYELHRQHEALSHPRYALAA